MDIDPKDVAVGQRYKFVMDYTAVPYYVTVTEVRPRGLLGDYTIHGIDAPNGMFPYQNIVAVRVVP